MKKKILFIFGTRPEAIKLAPLIILGKQNRNFRVFTCSTGQHKEMLSQVIDFFSIKIDYSLRVMKPNQSLSYLTGEIAKGLEDIISETKFDLIIVQGDTTTAFIGSLIAFYHKIPIAHVEAGLRTHDKYAPFPEESNRAMISRISDFNFTPTVVSQKNLLRENIDSKNIFITGNTVIDALLLGRKIIKSKTWSKKLKKEFEYLPKNKRLILVTGHRRESFGLPFENICNAIKTVAEQRKDIHIIYPVHLNPNVRRPVMNILGNINNITLIEPVSYPEMIYLMEFADVILTDSGGVQEEAPSFCKPVFVMRDVTERPEGITAGVAKLVGSDSKKIVSNIIKVLNDDKYYKSFSLRKNPYGDGKASRRILNIFEEVLR